MSWTQTSDTKVTAAIATVAAGATLTDGWIDLTGGVWSGTNIASDTNTGDYYLASTKQGSPWSTGQLLRPASEDAINQRITFQVCLNTAQTYYAMLRANRATASGNAFLVSIDYMSDKKFAIHGFALVAGKLTQIVGQDLATQPAAGDVVTVDIQLTQATTTTSELVVSVTNAAGAVLGSYDSGTANAQVNSSALQNVAGSIGMCAYSGSVGNAAGLKEVTVYSGDTASSTATKYTVAPASATVQTGGSTEVTFTLDAAAAKDITITPGDGGAGGSWSANTLKIAAGDLSGTLEYTAPSAAKTVTLTGTNDSSLTNGAASLTVQAGAVAPTKITLSLSETSVAVGGVLTATFTLDQPAVTPVTITPETVGNVGSFASSTVVIAAGQTSASVQWTAPASAATVTMGCKNDSSLTNDSGETVTVTAAPVTPTAPGAPGVTLTAGNGQIVVNVVAPASNGGAAITGYPIVVNDATSPVTTLTAAGSYTITDLTNGTAYKVKVGATNSVGTTYSADQTATPLAPGSAVPVSDPSFLFSPGNWYGDTGRAGSSWRRTWNVGAYFVFTFNASASPTATLHLGPSGTGANVTYYVNGVGKTVSANGDVALSGLVANAVNTVFVLMSNTPQSARWGQGANNLVVSGVTLDAGSKARASVAGTKGWIKIVGDSITEGINSDGSGKDNFLSSYTFQILMSLRARGYEVCVSACGYSGYLVTGDSTADVPAYYMVSGSVNGSGGAYADALSRWNKIDAAVSALDSAGRLSAYGDTGSEPAAIVVNYLTNEALGKKSTSDSQAAMMQCMVAHRSAAPNAQLVQILPFGFYYAAKYPVAYLNLFNAAFTGYQAAYPADKRVSVADIGADMSVLLESNTNWYINTDNVHPLERGHAMVAPVVQAAIVKALEGSAGQARSPNYGPASGG
ncbi:MAG: SGNH/GDSL hydrolase family protein [Acetobacter sp.]|uniref:fibronectin type III domain-containing protein n=1 Tax=Acetobacter sp. TaxID=440 RepID=UPI0039E79799